MNRIGVDIGGTKCAVVLGDEAGRIIKKEKFATEDCAGTLAKIVAAVEAPMAATFSSWNSTEEME